MDCPAFIFDVRLGLLVGLAVSAIEWDLFFGLRGGAEGAGLRCAGGEGGLFAFHLVVIGNFSKFVQQEVGV